MQSRDGQSPHGCSLSHQHRLCRAGIEHGEIGIGTTGLTEQRVPGPPNHRRGGRHLNSSQRAIRQGETARDHVRGSLRPKS